MTDPDYDPDIDDYFEDGFAELEHTDMQAEHAIADWYADLD